MGSELPPDTVFVSYKEEKHTVVTTVGERRVLKIFLVDSSGNKHLAATGEDLGDAHYAYRSSRPFTKYGQLDCHNRNELHIWLEMVISESGGQVQAAHLAADEQNPEGIYFTSHRYERAHYPDGRRCNRWYLMDQHGDSHLAVIGIERDTKDGHYHYSAEEPFAGIMPLHCSNQAGVYKWLEKMVTHHAGNGADAPAPAASYGGGSTGSTNSGFSGGDYGTAAAAGGRKPPLVINLATIRAARKSAAALHSLEQCTIVEGQQVRAKPKAKAPPIAPPPLPATTTQKHKSVGIVQQNQIKKARKLQEDLRAEEEKLHAAHLARLRRAAAAEVSADTAAKATTLGWLHCSLSQEEGEHLDHWLGLLKAVLDMQEEQQQQDGKEAEAGEEAAAAAEAAAEAGKDGSSNGAAAEAAAGAAAETGDVMVWIKQPANRQHHLRVALECLKELGAQDLPARVLLTRKVIPLVQRCVSWQHTAVTSMAQNMLRRWRWQLAGHMHVLGCPTYMEDHLGALEEDIAAGMVPLPQLPKHKQALLNTPIPKLPLLNAATPAPAKYSSYSNSSSHQHHPMPGSAPAMLNAGMGMQQYAGQQAGFTAGSGFVPHPMGSLTPGIGTPGGFFTPMGAATPGMVPTNAALAGMPGVMTSAAGGTPGESGVRGTGARGMQGVAAQQAAAGTAAAAAAAGLYGQAGAAAGYMDPSAVGMFSGGWPATQGMVMMPVDGTAAGAGLTAGPASGSSTDLAAMAAAAAAGGGVAAQQQQHMALFAMQQQPQQVAAGMQVQYGQLQQQAGLNAQQQQLTLQWQQQQQQAMYWQQQQHMQAVWGSGGGTSSGLAQQQQQQQGSGQQQQSSSQGFLQQ